MDVVCNLIGGLLLIAIISALASRDPVFNVFSPIEDVSSEDAVSHKFAVTEKGIYPMDQPEALANSLPRVRRDRTRRSCWSVPDSSGGCFTGILDSWHVK